MSSVRTSDADIRTAGRFSTLPARAFADVRLKAIDLQCFGMLAITESGDAIQRRDGWFQISQSKLAKWTGVSRPTINKSIKRLFEAEYINQNSSVTSDGACSASLYRIVYDGDLPVEFDRWQGAEPIGGSRNTGVIQENTSCKPEEHPSGNTENPTVSEMDRGVNEENTPCKPNEHPLENSRNRAVNELNRGDAEATTQQIQGVQGRLESTTSNEVERIEFETDNEQIVETFLSLRKKYYPEIHNGVSARAKLLEQASHYLERGLSVNRFIEILSMQIQITSGKGVEAPAGITRFKRDLEKAISELNPITLSPKRQPHPESAVKQRGTITDDARAKWDKVQQLFQSNPKISKWQNSIEFAGVYQGKALLKVTSVVIKSLLEKETADILSAFKSYFGNVQAVEIIKR